MIPELKLDDHDLQELRRAIERLPGEIKSKAMRRAMGRLQRMARTRIVDRSSKHTQMPKELVASMTTASFNAGGNTSRVTMESGWISLQRLGAVQNASGVYVNLRGSYRHAFVAQMSSGHVGVFRRVPGTQMEKGRGQRLREQFAANPAHAVTNNPEVYLAILAELIEEHLYPRYAHEVNYLLSQAGSR